MLSELRVRQLGVIEDLALVLGPGMTALTGETGAGKTLLVEAIQLLLGGRADPVLVRPGAGEATVEGRFVLEHEDDQESAEVVLSRVVPAEGRSRAYVDNRMVTVGTLSENGERLVDLHGQHAHQSLLSVPAQRAALDAFAGGAAVCLARRHEARAALRQVEALMAEVGGAGPVRTREMEFLRFQLDELSRASITGPDEDEQLAEEEERLAGAASHRDAAHVGYESLAGEDQVLDRLGTVVGSLAGHPPLRSVYERLRGTAAELADAAAELREAGESLEDDPARLSQVTERRAFLHELRRKYAGPGGDLAGVLAFAGEAARRLAELESLEEVAADLGRRHDAAAAELVQASRALGDLRRGAAPGLGRAVEAELRRLAMPRARFEVRVGEGSDELSALAGDEVIFLLAANPGEPLLPLSKVASGGELARAMLALRLVLLGSAKGVDQGPFTLIFDEVDAGIGGEAALAVGRALAELGRQYQVLVVTHLAQVAAFAGCQVAVRKGTAGRRTLATATVVEGEERVIELSRMLSGQPGSATARKHAQELLRSTTVRDGLS